MVNVLRAMAGHVLEVALLQLFVHQCFELKGMTVYKFKHMALHRIEEANFWPLISTCNKYSLCPSPRTQFVVSLLHCAVVNNFPVLWAICETIFPFISTLLLLFYVYIVN